MEVAALHADLERGVGLAGDQQEFGRIAGAVGLLVGNDLDFLAAASGAADDAAGDPEVSDGLRRRGPRACAR